jgi:hypothetical protein
MTPSGRHRYRYTSKARIDADSHGGGSALALLVRVDWPRGKLHLQIPRICLHDLNNIANSDPSTEAIPLKSFGKTRNSPAVPADVASIAG